MDRNSPGLRDALVLAMHDRGPDAVRELTAVSGVEMSRVLANRARPFANSLDGTQPRHGVARRCRWSWRRRVRMLDKLHPMGIGNGVVDHV